MKAMKDQRKRLTTLVCFTALGLGLGFGVDAAWAGPRRVTVLHHAAPVRGRPLDRTVARTVEVPAVYEVRPREIRHEPVYEERQVLVELPAEVVRREVSRFDLFGRLIGYDIVEEVVRPARKVWRTERVLIRAGYYEIVNERVLVRPTTTRIVYEQVLIRPAHRPGRVRLAVHKARPYARVTRVHDRYDRRDGGLHLAVRFGG